MSDQMNEKTVKSLLLVLFFLGLSISLFLIFGSKLNLLLNQGDSINMLERAWKWVEAGKFTPFGQGMSGGGKVPGSLTTLLVGIPLWLWPSYQSPVLIIVLFHVISYLAIDRILASHFGSLERILFAIFYWLNPWRVIYGSFLWNPNYLFMFGAVHFYTAFRLRKESNLFLEVLHLLSIGFALQLHGSFLILALATLALQFRNQIKLSLSSYVISALIILATLFPSLVAIFQGTGKQVTGNFYGRGLIYGYPIKAALYWIRYSSFYLPNEILLIDVESISHSKIAATLLTLWDFLKYPLAAVSLIVSFMTNYDLYERIKDNYFQWNPDTPKPRGWIYHYLTTIFLCVLISTALSPAHLQFWHLFIIMPLACIPLVFYVSDTIRDRNEDPWRRYFAGGFFAGGFLLSAIFFLGCLTLFFSLENNLSYSYEAERQRKKFKKMKEVQELYPKQAIKRIQESLQNSSNEGQ